MLKKLFIAAMAAGAMAATTETGFAADSGPETAEVSTFATLPDGVRFPEGITANPANGNIYVGTFDNGGRPNKLLRYNNDGELIAQRDFGGTPLLGLGFANNKVYILNFGASKLQRIAANFNSGTTVEDVADIPHNGPPPARVVPNPDGSSDSIVFGSNSFPAPNAMVFDRHGTLYVSDSFQGAIWKLANAASCPTLPPPPAPPPAGACAFTEFAHDSLLATAGFPPFGANGLALNGDESILYIANTGDNRVLQMTLPGKAISVFAESLHGADGLLFNDGVLWVAANQADELVALNDKGRPIARVGTFEGIRGNGSPRGLLFPASMVLVDKYMYVANLALALTPAVGDEPEEDVTRWNIARFKNPLRH